MTYKSQLSRQMQLVKRETSSVLIELVGSDLMAAANPSTIDVSSVQVEQSCGFGTKTRFDTLYERLNFHKRSVKKLKVYRSISIRKYGELLMRGVVGLPTTEGLLT
jgi:hypothetical protein